MAGVTQQNFDTTFHVKIYINYEIHAVEVLHSWKLRCS